MEFQSYAIRIWSRFAENISKVLPFPSGSYLYLSVNHAILSVAAEKSPHNFGDFIIAYSVIEYLLLHINE
jgi:hypothetical protein